MGIKINLRSKRLRYILSGMAILLFLCFILINECTYDVGMGPYRKECTCRGREFTLYDATAADGPMKSLCVGIITSTRCYNKDMMAVDPEKAKIDCKR